MRISSLAAVAISGLALQLAVSAAPKEKAEKDHKLSEWKIGSVLFGDKVSKSDMKGKVVVIENWGVRCPPCVASLPHLAELYKRNREKGLIIIGAESQGSSKDDIEPLIKKAKVEYTITDGADGPIEVTGIPRIFVFDRSGALTFDGHPASGDFESAVKKALREAAEGAETPVVASGPLIASRAWTNTQGQKITAAVKSADDTKVVFQMANGKVVDYDLSKLDDESRETIAEAVKAAKEKAEGGAGESEE
jgi:thiol-disulfide isomerase/thioredoxin